MLSSRSHRLVSLYNTDQLHLANTHLRTHARAALLEQEEVKPVLFVTGAGMTPVQAPARNMETHGSLLKWVQTTATPGAAPVTSTRELESKCLKKERCALVMKAGPLEVGMGRGVIVDFFYVFTFACRCSVFALFCALVGLLFFSLFLRVLLRFLAAVC